MNFVDPPTQVVMSLATTTATSSPYRLELILDAFESAPAG